jgi:hypothetical protein
VGVREGKVVLFKGFPFWGLASVEEETDIEVDLLSNASRRKVQKKLEVESLEDARRTLILLEEEASDYAIVPDVVGMKYEEAKEKLQAAGLHVVEPPELVTSGNARVGTVFQQEPDPYTRVGIGEDVRLKVVGGRTSEEV